MIWNAVLLEDPIERAMKSVELLKNPEVSQILNVLFCVDHDLSEKQLAFVIKPNNDKNDKRRRAFSAECIAESFSAPTDTRAGVCRPKNKSEFI
jgi:hypothetical protein